MSAYSAVPVKVFSTSYNTSEQFKYIVNICWDGISITANTSYSIFNSLFTKLTSSTPHNFENGDKVFVDDNPNSDVFTGYYNIRKIISTTEFVIDLEPTSPFGANPFNVYKVIKYKLSPDLDGYGKLDLSNTLKDFVSQNLTGQTSSYGLSYDGVDTRFDYNIICGSEEKYILPFEDNIFLTGNTGFYNSSITGMTGIPFEIGDAILIQQELYGWSYIDNVFDGGNVGYTGATTVPFTIGQQVTVTGQITYPSYNGLTTMLDTGSTTNILITEKSWVGATSVQGGVIYGTPRPEYNTVGIIVDIYIDPTYGLVILTNLPWGGSSPTLPGTIRYASDILTTQSNILTISGLSVYNSYQNRIDYSITGFDPYVIQDRAANLNNISTILNSDNQYRIEPSTIGFLLTHLEDTNNVVGMGYQFYNSSNTLLGNLLITGLTSEDYYSPIGLEQIALLNGVEEFGISFSGYSGSVDNYCMFAANNCGCNAICVNLVYKPGSGTTNTQCVIKEDGLINGNPYFIVDVVQSSITYPAQLWYVLGTSPIDDGWYLTNTGITEYSAITQTWMFDKTNSTDCAVGDTWSTSIGSPLSGGSHIGTSVVADPSACITSYSNDICFKLNPECSKYELYNLMWKDKNGSFISYPFKFVSRDNIEVERKNYYQSEGNWGNDTFGYDDYGRGDKTFHSKSRKNLVLNSGWLYEFERDLIEDLIQSPSVYVQTPSNQLIGCTLDEKKLEIYKQINEDLFNYSFNVILASNEFRF
jgi:hypothetical protein